MRDRFVELTLLHSNDTHADFTSDNAEEEGFGGISRLSGYVSQARAEDPDLLYCIAGDMLQGSLIDTEFRGFSTIEIMNIISPDIVSLGNHEIDYGLGHLLFLERCAKFPIVCANLFIKNPRTRLFTSHKIRKVKGLKVMFIGLITSEILSTLKKDNLLSTLLDVEDAAREVGRICNAYRTTEIDLTVLLTHIGFDEDKQLAAMLDPDWGVDLIIGGHSHSFLDAPEEVNGVLIATAGHGSEQIGRFDLVVDTALSRVKSYNWQLISLKEVGTPRDPQLEATIRRFKETVDAKYDAVLCRFARVHTHPDRYRETALGNLIADALKESLGLDLMVLGSGSIRRSAVGPVFTRGDLIETVPFDEHILALRVTGGHLKRMIAHVLRDETLDGGHGEFYQYSKGLRVTFNRETKAFERFDFHGSPLDDDDVLRIGLHDYHYKSFEDFFAVSRDELPESKGKVVATSSLDVLEEYFVESLRLNVKVEGRLVIVGQAK